MSKSMEDMPNYKANYRSHVKGMKPEEVSQYYTRWSENQQYEQDLDSSHYHGPKIAAETVAELYSSNRDKVRVIDVACGTGLVGEQLYQLGFRTMDGLDPSEGMLQLCRKKNIYTDLVEDYCCDKPSSIADSIYDCAVVSGGFGESHIPCSGLNELIRVVKTGGYIVIVMRKEYLGYVSEYAGRLEPLMKTLELDGKWRSVDRREVNSYSFQKQGIVYTFQVTKGQQ